jgi:putative DNA primase/helicase
LPPERVAVRDNGLTARLREEWPAILRWMIDGCLEWQRVGLKPPLQVIADSVETIQSDDLLAQWRLDPARCEDLAPSTIGRDLISLCNRSYNDFCATRGERTASYNAFATMLKQHDIGKHKTSAGIVPLGFQLAAAERARLTGLEELV